LDDEPVKAEGEGLEPPRDSRRHLFSRQAPHPAGCLPYFISSGGWNRTNGLLVQSQASLPAATTPDHSRFNGKQAHTWFASSCGGRNRTCGLLVQSQASLPTATTPQLRVPCGSRTRLARLEAWSLCRSAKDTCSGRRGSRTLKAHRSTAFEAAAVANRLALPFYELRRQESNLRLGD
jgi:hypothetical protein